jgi:hypothetical protein
MRKSLLLVVGFGLAISMNGCIGGAAMMALSATGGAVAIAKDVFDIDVDIHTLIGQSKPTAPIPPVVVVTHPQYLVETPPANASLNGR